MAQVFNLPAVGDTMTEGEIVEWFVGVGDAVTLDQPICAIETDKSVVEMTTPYRGTVLDIGGQPGDVVEVGAMLIVVGEPGEASPQPAPPTSAAPIQPSEPATHQAPSGAGWERLTSPLVRKLAQDNDVDPSHVVGSGFGGRVTRQDVQDTIAAGGALLAMPRVRKAARKASVDLRTVRGTGPSGSIQLSDLEAVTEPSERRVRLSTMRRTIAHHLTESATTIPQFTSMVDVDATGLIATRAALAKRREQPLPLDALLVAMLIPVLDDHPLMNAHLDGEEIVYPSRRDIGVAVDTQDGLMVPVVRNAASLSVSDIADEIVRLAEAARGRFIAPADLAGGTCTVNNVGAIGIVAGTPILPLGTSTIVAFGRSRGVVQLREGNPVEVPVMTLSATFDHRLIDGGDAGRFLTQLKEHLEVPALGTLS